MYKNLIRPVLFFMGPEFVHHLIVSKIRFFFKLPGISWLFKKLYDYQHPSLKREVFGLQFKNPVGLAAGFDKNAGFYNEFSAFGFGHIEIGTVTPKGQKGNPKPRLFRLPADEALINRMGFNNHGLEAAIKRLKKRKTTIIIGGNIGKNTMTPNRDAVEDYVKSFEGLFDWVDYFVVNVSCPNITDLHELQDQEKLTEILLSLQALNKKKPQPKAILLKVSPDLNDGQLDEVIQIISKTGIDGVVATNTTLTRNLIHSPEKLVSKIGQGGLSGKPIRDRSTEVIRYLHQQSKGAFPIIGVGGIHSAADALEKLEAGAALVQIYTGFIYAGPALVKQINKSLVRQQSNRSN